MRNIIKEVLEDMSDSNDSKLKKQKAGLGAIRPSDYIENKFKEMAKEKSLSQTDMFERIFLSYLNNDRQEKRKEALNCEGEINLIANELNNILEHFKNINNKAQDKILTLLDNAEQGRKNWETEKNTLSLKIEELNNRNKELEEINNAFSEIKKGLENEANKKVKIIGMQEDNIKELKETVKERNSKIEDFEKQLINLTKENDNYKKEISLIQTEMIAKITYITKLETTNNSLQSTLDSIEPLKKAEISAIETKYEAIITDLKTKLQDINEAKDKQAKEIEDKIRIKYEAEKKLEIAELKIELANIQGKYNEIFMGNKQK